MKYWKSRTREEINASGISEEEPGEIDVMMEEIIGM
jgi:hypothetical protein